jgi:transcription termination factor Rho
MSVLDRGSLEQSPLADLHAIASELSIDGYRRLRKPELIEAILERQGGGDGGAARGDAGAAGEEDEDQTAAPRRRRGRRGGRGRSGSRSRAEETETDSGEDEPEEDEDGEASAPAAPEAEEPARDAEELVDGVVELLPNGSGFVRATPPEPSDEDVYISAAQVKRCELVSGDRVSGPRRPPRRSERFASLVRIDTVNGNPASELADGAHFDDKPAAFPSERFVPDPDDPTLTAVDSLAPIGRGSRVTIAGVAQTGKTEILRRLAAALGRDDDLQVSVVLVGVRPEELPEWSEGPQTPAAALGLSSSLDAQGQAVETSIEQARRMAARGSHAVVLIDTLDGLPAHVVRRALGSARRIIDSGSVTVIATASAPHGGETAVIALDAAAARAGRFPALDAASSWTARPEQLVGAEGAEEIARNRAQALGG